MNKWRSLTLCVVIGSAATNAGVLGAGPQFLGIGKAKAIEYKVFESPDGKVVVEYPTKDWNVISGTGGSLIISRRDGSADVVIDPLQLKAPLTDDEITDRLAAHELELLKVAQPKASNLKAVTVKDFAGRRAVVIDFTKTGTRGVEQARQYTVPVGSHLFRLLCSALPEPFKKHAPVFEHIAQTIKPVDKPPAGSGGA